MYISNMIGNTTHMHKQDEHVSFDKFALLSVKAATLSTPPPRDLSSGTDVDRFIHEGPRYLDSFFLDTADLLDEFPKKGDDGDKEADIDPMALSTFCFPDGLRVRVVPRAAMEGAKRLGWTGRKADRSHFLVVSAISSWPMHLISLHHGLLIVMSRIESNRIESNISHPSLLIIFFPPPLY